MDKQPDVLKVFISYSRRDMAISDALVMDLENADIEVLIDRRDLPFGEQWQRELTDFINSSDTVVWLVSPDSLKSTWCRWELDRVMQENKRLVPVRIRDVSYNELPEEIGRVHMLPVEGNYRTEAHLSALGKSN